jgi:hypothetical protein
MNLRSLIRKLVPTLGALAICSMVFAPLGCTKQLAQGGAYAPGITTSSTNSTGGIVLAFTPTTAPDYGFFVVDSAFSLAYTTLDTAFTIERDNRAFLWKLDPNIKHTLDSIRPDSVKWKNAYLDARKSYLLTATPAGLSAMQTALTQIQNAAAAAAAAIPKSTTIPAK